MESPNRIPPHHPGEVSLLPLNIQRERHFPPQVRIREGTGSTPIPASPFIMAFYETTIRKLYSI